ncbi:P-loop containing nucleoside triphosphate hydrolase protein [Cristinia sonorae]|uniref:P-loop containing nucleoside triphosphate hydrolase protein n=1 Tax=Cristinia sonorae TaxID=1940300 RepID=A0A8K0UKP3_9AGAR|nr:P-loop containing nucleoside triphosphate hydrolase protein [Cristinia sonorae]
MSFLQKLYSRSSATTRRHNPNVQRFNVVVLGAGGVGKSALTFRFAKNSFNELYNPTTEETYCRDIFLNGERYAMEIVDTAGAEQFTELNEQYVRAAHGFVLVFSLTYQASLREIDDIRKQVSRVKGANADTPIIVVGTKLDLVHEREVTRDKIRQLVNKWGITFYETSAKQNWHISDVFQDLLAQMRDRYKDVPTSQKQWDQPKRKKWTDQCLIM